MSDEQSTARIPWNHEQYESGGSLVLFRCKECGHTEISLGGMHGHCEKHRGYTRWNIQIPFTKTSMGDFDALMDYTEVLRVEETSEISLSEVEGL